MVTTCYDAQPAGWAAGSQGGVDSIGRLILFLGHVCCGKVRSMCCRILLVAGIAVWLAIGHVGCTTSDGLSSMDRNSFIPEWSAFQRLPKQSEPPLE